MKKIILVRSLRVALVIAILSFGVKLTIFNSGWFVLLLLPSMLFLDATDSMLMHSLWRIEDAQMGRSFKYIYLISTLIAILFGTFVLVSIDKANQYASMWIIFAVLTMIFSLKYFIIIVRVLYGLKVDAENQLNY